jgi:hypothetical protein
MSLPLQPVLLRKGNNKRERYVETQPTRTRDIIQLQP